MPLLEIDEELSVSLTWSVDEDGTLRHNPSGMRVSPDKGVVLDGQEYRLSPQDIDLDRSCTLGTGAGGVVQAGVHKPTGMRVAIKTVKVDHKEKREQMLKEIKGLVLAAGCPYLVQWYAGFVGKDTGLVHVVVELMDRGSLADLRRRCAGPVPPEQLACVAAQVVRGLAHLQSRRLLHRDVKPENVLHNSLGQVKLTDFGISKDLTSTAGVAASFVGTANYMSPERALGKDYSFRSDVWSAGMVVLEMANGKPKKQDRTRKVPLRGEELPRPLRVPLCPARASFGSGKVPSSSLRLRGTVLEKRRHEASRCHGAVEA
ncbi:unnamed protein product [Durusdinium trenchii]|uniref:mitogen-activated protein kinase kinase n=1 Tax=Durusdinium trenchii TaxID=1381693 RepID=A0ABP0PUQ8_9DINO